MTVSPPTLREIFRGLRVATDTVDQGLLDQTVIGMNLPEDNPCAEIAGMPVVVDETVPEGQAVIVPPLDVRVQGERLMDTMMDAVLRAGARNRQVTTERPAPLAPNGETLTAGHLRVAMEEVSNRARERRAWQTIQIVSAPQVPLSSFERLLYVPPNRRRSAVWPVFYFDMEAGFDQRDPFGLLREKQTPPETKPRPEFNPPPVPLKKPPMGKTYIFERIENEVQLVGTIPTPPGIAGKEGRTFKFPVIIQPHIRSRVAPSRPQTEVVAAQVIRLKDERIKDTKRRRLTALHMEWDGNGAAIGLVVASGEARKIKGFVPSGGGRLR